MESTRGTHGSLTGKKGAPLRMSLTQFAMLEFISKRPTLNRSVKRVYISTIKDKTNTYNHRYSRGPAARREA